MNGLLKNDEKENPFFPFINVSGWADSSKEEC
jgi:hypothetical protein